MPWTEQQHGAALIETLGLLSVRQDDGREVDLDPRVVESIALENAGNALYPRSRVPLTGRRLERSLTSGRYDRWATIVWRARLAETLARSIVRKEAFASGDLEHALEVSTRLRKGRR